MSQEQNVLGGDIRDKKVRDAIKPYLQTGIVWLDTTLEEYECRLIDGRLNIGLMAFAMLCEYAPQAPITRKSDWN